MKILLWELKVVIVVLFAQRKSEIVALGGMNNSVSTECESLKPSFVSLIMPAGQQK